MGEPLADVPLCRHSRPLSQPLLVQSPPRATAPGVVHSVMTSFAFDESFARTQADAIGHPLFDIGVHGIEQTLPAAVGKQADGFCGVPRPPQSASVPQETWQVLSTHAVAGAAQFATVLHDPPRADEPPPDEPASGVVDSEMPQKPYCVAP
jgi:hypothetical protein